jgi:arginine decarboxylase
VKCNQQRHVVEELVSCGKRWNFGLEAGSKAELLIALSLLDDPDALLICNGYKDRLYIETAILARRLGRRPVVVIEQPDEVIASSRRAATWEPRPTSAFAPSWPAAVQGRWGSSVGDKAKFGLAIPDLLTTVERLRENGLLDDLRLLHFHIGSQINDIAVLKDALQEAGQIYVELTRLGAPMGFLDVGGGLGIDYDGSRTGNGSLHQLLTAELRQRCGGHGAGMLRTQWGSPANTGERKRSRHCQPFLLAGVRCARQQPVARLDPPRNRRGAADCSQSAEHARDHPQP